MHELIKIGSTWNMEKVMLTVLKGMTSTPADVLGSCGTLPLVNSDAVRFYREIGCAARLTSTVTL